MRRTVRAPSPLYNQGFTRASPRLLPAASLACPPTRPTSARAAGKSGFDGISATLADLVAKGPYDGVIGFSQGGAVACMVPSRWILLFSTIAPPSAAEVGIDGSDADSFLVGPSRLSLHAFDPTEEYAPLCREVAGRFEDPNVLEHTAGHTVPMSGAGLTQARAFLQARCEEASVLDD